MRSSVLGCWRAGMRAAQGISSVVTCRSVVSRRKRGAMISCACTVCTMYRKKETFISMVSQSNREISCHDNVGARRARKSPNHLEPRQPRSEARTSSESLFEHRHRFSPSMSCTSMPCARTQIRIHIRTRMRAQKTREGVP